MGWNCYQCNRFDKQNLWAPITWRYYDPHKTDSLSTGNLFQSKLVYIRVDLSLLHPNINKKVFQSTLFLNPYFRPVLYCPAADWAPQTVIPGILSPLRQGCDNHSRLTNEWGCCRGYHWRPCHCRRLKTQGPGSGIRTQ